MLAGLIVVHSSSSRRSRYDRYQILDRLYTRVDSSCHSSVKISLTETRSYLRTYDRAADSVRHVHSSSSRRSRYDRYQILDRLYTPYLFLSFIGLGMPLIALVPLAVMRRKLRKRGVISERMIEPQTPSGRMPSRP